MPRPETQGDATQREAKRRSSPLRPTRFLVLVLLVSTALWSAGATSRAARAGDAATEYELKAAFLYNFAKYVDWPLEDVPEPDRSFVIAVIGSDPFGPALDALAGKTVKGRRVAVKRLDDSDSPAGCDVLFISNSEEKKLDRVLAAVHGGSALTVSDVPGFAGSGGAIEFVTVGSKVRFRINAAAAEEAGLRVSSQLLKLAIAEGHDQ